MDDTYDFTAPDTSYYPDTASYDFGSFYDPSQYQFDTSGFQFAQPSTDYLSSLMGSPDLGNYMAQFSAPSPEVMADFSQTQLSPIEQAMYTMSSVTPQEDLSSVQNAAAQLGVDPTTVTSVGNGVYEVGGKLMTDAEIAQAAQAKAASNLTGEEGIMNGLRNALGGQGSDQGLKGSIVHALGGKTADGTYDPSRLGVEQTPYGLQTGALTADNMLEGVRVAGAPNQVRLGSIDLPTSVRDAQLLGNEGVYDAWGRNADSMWSDYAKTNGLNPSDIGVDAASMLPSLRMLTGSKESPSALQKIGQALANAIKPGTSTGKTYRRNADGSITETSNQESSLLAKALQAYGILAGGGGKAPDAIGDKSAQAWKLSRAAGSGRKMATGGRVMGAGGSAGALGLMKGGTAGQSDKVPAQLSHGEYVMDADVVSALGDGNTDAGAAKLDQMRNAVRSHKRSAPASKIPPKAKSPLQYMNGAK